ncbi:MAG: hypothetical protein ABI114_00470 [Rhodanobacter sp.]
MTFAQHQFKPGHVSQHDLSAAGRASRKVSKWGHSEGQDRPMSKQQLRERRLALIKHAAQRVSNDYRFTP